jgi:hypothetical protein
MFQSGQTTGHDFQQPTGRWPANLLLDSEAAEMLDEQAGIHPGCKTPSTAVCQSKFRPNQGKAMPQGPIYGDSGGVSRLFYCAKASRSERDPQGIKNDHATVKPLALMEYLLTLLSTPDGGVILDPVAGSGTTLLAAKRLGRRCIGVELDPHNCEIAKDRILQISQI